MMCAYAYAHLRSNDVLSGLGIERWRDLALAAAMANDFVVRIRRGAAHPLRLRGPLLYGR